MAEIMESMNFIDRFIQEDIAEGGAYEGRTVHLNVAAGRNDHHKMEAMFKAFGLALRDAAAYDARITGVLSTKGMLD